jgi:hypothetical protein
LAETRSVVRLGLGFSDRQGFLIIVVSGGSWGGALPEIYKGKCILLNVLNFFIKDWLIYLFYVNNIHVLYVSYYSFSSLEWAASSELSIAYPASMECSVE